MKSTNLSKAAAPIFAALLTKTDSYRSVGLTDTAKLIRAALKDAFPGVKFSVTSKSYSGGCSISVRWVDGPSDKEVSAVCSPYEGADFDGSIDLKTYASAWFSEDGKVSVAHASGTVGSMGQVPEVIGSAHNPNAIEVHFSADYIHTHREFSPAAKRAALAAVLARWAGCAELNPQPQYVERVSAYGTYLDLSSDPWIASGNGYLSTLVGQYLHGRSEPNPSLAV